MEDLSHKQILVLYTGGTIGMVSTENGYDVERGYLGKAIENVSNFHHYNMPKFHVKEYSRLIDSSNVKPESWVTLAQDIIRHYDNYDGFVVLHGTDTMAYSASVLSFMLGDIQKPVIFTGSQIPMSQVRSDATLNILNSLLFACDDNIKEVCVFFDKKLLRGNRTTKISATGFEAFGTPNYPALAKVGIDLNLNKKRLLERKSTNKAPKLETFGVPKIAVLTIFPGIDYSILETILEPPLQGLILKTFGAGNMANDPHVHEILKRASDRGVVIVNCTQCLYGTVKMGAYKVAGGLAAAGVISGHDMTDEAALGKLFYLLSRKDMSNEDVRKAFEISLQGEVTISE